MIRTTFEYPAGKYQTYNVKAQATAVSSYGATNLKLYITDEDGNEATDLDNSTLQEIRDAAVSYLEVEKETLNLENAHDY